MKILKEYRKKNRVRRFKITEKEDEMKNAKEFKKHNIEKRFKSF